jgi:uncharacterized protein (TIGR02246 family)
MLLAGGQAFADAAADVEKLEQERLTAYVKSDVAALNRIFADDIVYIHSNGVADTKATVVQSFASGDLKISRFDGEDIKVRQVGDVMIATGIAHAELVNKGNAAKFDIRYTAIYANRGGQWRLVHIQNGRIPPKS